MSTKKISVIIPVFNEASNIALLYQRLKNVLSQITGKHEIIFINDGSRDQSLDIIKKLSHTDVGVKYIDFSRNFGHQVAVTAGLQYATGDKIVIIDADLQDPPELILQMNQMLESGWNVVYAKRKIRKGDSFLKKITARIFYRFLSVITSVSIPVDTGDFRMIDRRVANALNQMPERHKFIRGMVSWVGFRQTFVLYEREGRHRGKTGYTYWKMFRLALDGITGFSTFPLKVATIAGFVVSFFSFLLILYTLYARLILKDYQPGWASIMISILFIGGIQLICLGIIGEYLSRMDSNVRQRPLYLINETNIETEPVLK